MHFPTHQKHALGKSKTTIVYPFDEDHSPIWKEQRPEPAKDTTDGITRLALHNNNNDDDE